MQIVNEARARVKEVTVDDVKAMLDKGRSSCSSTSARKASSRRTICPARSISARASSNATSNSRYPIPAPLVLYCGGGYRSALAADNLQKMGYTNVISMDGGIRDWREKQYPLTTG